MSSCCTLLASMTNDANKWLIKLNDDRSQFHEIVVVVVAVENWSSNEKLEESVCVEKKKETDWYYLRQVTVFIKIHKTLII